MGPVAVALVYVTILGVCAQELAAGASVRRGWGSFMSDTASSPTAPPQDTAQPLSDAGGASGKTDLSKGKVLPGRVRKMLWKQPCEHPG